jgi:hypothetical protein
MLLTATLMAVSLVIALLLAELAVRLLRPQQLIIKRPDLWQAVAGVGWTHRANVRGTINTGEGLVHVYTDQDGYRIGAAGRKDGNRTILLLGDSFVEALQVEYEQSLAGLLEARLPLQIGTTVAVRNTGVGGWSPNEYLIQGRESLKREPVDLVVTAIFMGNDLVTWKPGPNPPRAPAEVHHFRLPRNLGFSELVDAVFYPVNDWLEVRSQLFTLLKHQSKVLLMRLKLSGAELPLEIRRSTAAKPWWSITAMLCDSIAQAAAAHGAAALFVLVPDATQVYPDMLQQYLKGTGVDSSAVDIDQPSRLFSAYLRFHHLNVIDATPALKAASKNGQPLYGKVDTHLTPAGHDVLERVVEPAIVQDLMQRVPRSGEPGHSLAFGALRRRP